MTISTPAAVNKMCANLNQGLDDFVTTADELVTFALHNIEPDEGAIIRSFIDEILGSRYSHDELKDWWWTTRADIVFHDGRELIKMLTLIRADLERPPYRTQP